MLLVSKVFLLLEVVFLFFSSIGLAFTVGPYDPRTKNIPSSYIHPCCKSSHSASSYKIFPRNWTLKPHYSILSVDSVENTHIDHKGRDNTQVNFKKLPHWFECIKNIFADRQVLEVSLLFVIIKVLGIKTVTRFFSRD